MSTTITASSAIPLMTHGPSPAAVNSAVNYRQGLIGALVAPLSGPMGWRSGVMSTTSTVSTLSVDLLAIPLGTPGQGVQVYPGNAVINRGPTVGPYLVCFNSTSTISLDAASTTNPRIDVIYLQVNDDAIGDAGATNGGFMAVVNGTPSSSPAVPSVPSGAIAIAQIYRNTVAGGGNVITTGNITDVRTSTSTAGGVRVYLPGDSTSAAGSYNGETTFDSVNYGLRYWAGGSSGAWHGVVPKTYQGVWANGTSDSTLSTSFSSQTTIMSVSIPDPGYAYRLRVSGNADVNAWGSFSAGTPPWAIFTIRVGSPSGTVINQSRSWAMRTDNIYSVNAPLAAYTSATMTGAQTVYLMGYSQVAGTILYSTVTTNVTYLEVDVIPI